MTSIPQPPNDADAEQQLIGCVMLDPGLVKAVAIDASEFYDERRAMIWRAIQAVAREGHAPDYANVTARLQADGHADPRTSTDLLSFLSSGIIISAHAQSYADRIRERAARRALLALAQDIAGGAYDLRRDLTGDRARWVTELIKTYHLRDQAEQIGATVQAVVAEIEEAAKHPKDVYGIETGFPDFDHITKGLHAGETFLLAGQPGMGKSLLAGQMLMQVALSGTPVAYYALEMSAAAMVRRMLSAETSIVTDRLRGGYVKDHELEKLYEAAGKLSDIPFYLSDSTQWDTAGLRADLARLKADSGIAVAAVDHDGLLTDRGFDPNERDKQISQALHSIAKDLDIAIVSVHTMNKTGLRSSVPTLGDASGSVKFVYDADVISFLTEHLPMNGETKQPNARTLTFAKYREGSPDRFLHFVQVQATENGKPRGLPRFECMAEY